MYSDGTDTRSFCYVSDAINGFLKILLSNFNGEAFNVGNDSEEISMGNLAKVISELFDNKIEIIYKESSDRNYLKDNPHRRCPDLTKIRKFLNYEHEIDLKTGLKKIIEWYKL
jgi:dTDP-glucose 4,6-dehydratase/UDP-glucuronate decarboxylase